LQLEHWFGTLNLTVQKKPLPSEHLNNVFNIVKKGYVMENNGVLEGDFNGKTYIMSMMSYLGVLCLVPILFNKDDEYVNFHARQGLVLWIWGVFSIFALYIPVIGKFFFGVSAFFILVLSFVGLFSIVFAKAWRIPIIGGLADQL